MTPDESAQKRGAGEKPAPATMSPRKLEFDSNKAFEIELRRRVDEFFKTSGRRKRDCWQMYLKTAVILASFAASYVLLVFWAHTLWQGLALAVLLALSVAAIGFNIMHDGGHKSYSARAWVNKAASMTMDLIGGSSYVWRWKHGIIHHMYVNITNYDNDIELGILGRLSPHHVRRSYYRWQYIYLWPLYGLLAIKWHLFDDFRNVFTRRIGRHPLPWPKGSDLILFFGGKAVFLSWAFALPLFFHPVTHVLFYYILASVIVGFLISVVFQIPHCGMDSDFPMPREDTGRMERSWAAHQVEVTTDFARGERVATWYLGGLNFHMEHHLFPVICHINYPAISSIVEATCREFGLRYTAHKTFRAGLASHLRWIREMGLPGREGTFVSAHEEPPL